MNVIVKEVKTKKELKEFVRFPNRLYRGNKYYVPQIESMELDSLDPKKNHAFEVCEAKFYLAYNEKGEAVGRIAAIVNKAYNEKVNEKICRFSYIDFINDKAVSEALIRTVENYAKENGYTRVCGPEGMLEFDVAGLLVEGYDEYPTAYGKYNYPYYIDHILSLGYVKDTDWVEYSIPFDKYDREKGERAAKLIAERYELHQAELKSRKDIYKYIDGVFEVMNRCYENIYGFSTLTPGQLEDLKKQFIPNADVSLVSIILDKNDKVVAFGICMPSFSKALIKAKGHLFPFGFIHILKALRKNDTLDALLISIDEEYQKKGVSAMMFDKIYYGFLKYGARYMESTRELENNNGVQNLFRKLAPRLHKRARSYSKTL